MYILRQRCNFYYTFFICNIMLKQSLFQHTDLDIMELKYTLRFPLTILYILLRHELAQGWCTLLHVTVGPVHRFWNKHSSCPIPYILHPLKCNIMSPVLSEYTCVGLFSRRGGGGLEVEKKQRTW